MTTNLLLLAARVLLSVIFIASGASKFADIGGTAGMIAQAGLPAATLLAWVSGIFELVAGLALLVGWMTRYAAWLLAAFCVVTALMFHTGAVNIPDFSEAANAMLSLFNQVMLMKNLAMAGGLLALSVAGAGAWSLDSRRA
jgi:putative oxidoreductase